MDVSEQKTKQNYSFLKVQEQVEAGKGLVIFDGKVLDVTKWMKIHPGGELIISHMLGRDATDQILTNHSQAVIDKYVKLFHVGNMVESERGKTFDRPLSLSFRRLHQKVTDDGLFKTNPWFYVKLYSCIVLLYILSFVTLYNFGDTLVGCTVSALLLALFWHQSASVMHDTGHNAITQNRNVDTAVGILFTNCFTGVSVGWWKTSHFIHHLVTNDPEHDPHIQLLPFIAITTRFFDSLYSTYYKKVFTYDSFAKMMVPIQHFTFLPLMCFARFVIYKDSVVYLLGNRPKLWKTELATIVIFWSYFTWMISLISDPRLRVLYFLLPVMVLIILQLQLFVSHNSMSTDTMEPGEDFAPYMLRTTLDFYCDEWFDWFHGGLQFQVAHHFFPRLPRHNLRRATEYVLEFCRQHKLEYNAMSFTGGNMKLLDHLKAIAEEAKYLAKSAKDQAHLMKNCQIKRETALQKHGS